MKFNRLTQVVILLLCMIAASQDSWADTQHTSALPDGLTPSHGIEEGDFFIPNGSSLYSLEVSEWGGGYLLTGLVSYGSNRLKYEVMVSRSSEGELSNFFTGNGTIFQRWESGVICTYRLRLEIYSYTNEELQNLLYVKLNAPSSVHTLWPIQQSGCPPVAGAYTWYYDKNPYTLTPE